MMRIGLEKKGIMGIICSQSEAYVSLFIFLIVP